MDKLIDELKLKIIDILNLQDVRPTDIHEDEPLVGGNLRIDSIDILELVIMIEKEYGITINNKEMGKKIFATLRTLAEYIHDNSQQLN
ncbi:MAG: acyl carrier protein [Desulfobacterales bacterium]|nr:acyl carrier protein [Desulfobacterales bacterium]